MIDTVIHLAFLALDFNRILMKNNASRTIANWIVNSEIYILSGCKIKDA